MANRYGEAALMVVRQASAAGANPLKLWENAMDKLYSSSLVARRKGGPRGAFLGLCEEGLVKGIPAGEYAASKKHKEYATQAVALLQEGGQSWSVNALWREVSEDPEAPHGSQMDVVMALWKNDFIVSKQA